MKNSDCAIPKAPFWSGFAASIPGGGHIRRGIPCQDASSVFTEPRPAAIVCDGRGSASLSHFGAQEAVKVFHFQVSVLNPYLENILDSEEKKEEQWIKFCRIMYRTLMQVKYDLAEKHHTNEKEFDCTVAFAVTGSKYIGCFQVGDGSIVLRQNGICKTVFIPEKGEFANQTHFLRAGGEEKMKFQYALFRTEENSGIAITSDGPEHLMFHLSDMTPGKIFDSLFDDLHKEELCRQDIMDYLTRREWADDPRGSDDRSLAVLARIGEEEKSLPEPKISENVIETTAIMPEEDEVKPIPAEKSAVPEPHDTETSAEPEKDNAAVNVKKKSLDGLDSCSCEQPCASDTDGSRGTAGSASDNRVAAARNSASSEDTRPKNKSPNIPKNLKTDSSGSSQRKKKVSGHRTSLRKRKYYSKRK